MTKTTKKMENCKVEKMGMGIIDKVVGFMMRMKEQIGAFIEELTGDLDAQELQEPQPATPVEKETVETPVRVESVEQIENFLNEEGLGHLTEIMQCVRVMFSKYKIRGGRLVCVLCALVKLGYVVDPSTNFMPGFLALINQSIRDLRARMHKGDHSRSLFDAPYEAYRYHPMHRLRDAEELRTLLTRDRMEPALVEKAVRAHRMTVANAEVFVRLMQSPPKSS